MAQLSIYYIVVLRAVWPDGITFIGGVSEIEVFDKTCKKLDMYKTLNRFIERTKKGRTIKYENLPSAPLIVNFAGRIKLFNRAIRERNDEILQEIDLRKFIIDCGRWLSYLNRELKRNTYSRSREELETDKCDTEKIKEKAEVAYRRLNRRTIISQNIKTSNGTFPTKCKIISRPIDVKNNLKNPCHSKPSQMLTHRPFESLFEALGKTDVTVEK